MGLLDAPLRSAAQTALRTFGTMVRLRRLVTAPFDATTDTVLATPIDRSVKALVTQARAHEARGPIQMGDYRVLFAAADVSETVDESWLLVLSDGQELEIVEVLSYIATDQAALVELYARGKRAG